MIAKTIELIENTRTYLKDNVSNTRIADVFLGIPSPETEEPYIVVSIGDSDGNEKEIQGQDEIINLQIDILATSHTENTLDEKQILRVYYARDEVKRAIYTKNFADMIRNLESFGENTRIQPIKTRPTTITINERIMKKFSIIIPIAVRESITQL